MRTLWLGFFVIVAAAAAPADRIEGGGGAARPAAAAGPEAVDFRRAVLPGPEARAAAKRWISAPNPTFAQDERPRPADDTVRPTAPRRPASDAPPGAVELSGGSKYFFHDEYLAVRAGPYWGMGSKNELDVAIYGELEFGHQFDEHAILQFQVGMLDGDEKCGGVKTEVSAVPLMVGGTGEWAIDRAELFVALSGGIAITEVRTTTAGTRAKGSKNLYCGSVRVGARYWVTDDLFLSLDGTYLFSTSKRFGGVNTDLDGFALLLGVGLGF